jgi:3-dehydroquinate dehydratase
MEALEKHYKTKHGISGNLITKIALEALGTGLSAAKAIALEHDDISIHNAIPYLIAAEVENAISNGHSRDIFIHALLNAVDSILKQHEAGQQ